VSDYFSGASYDIAPEPVSPAGFPSRRSRRALWIAMGAIGAVVLIVAVVLLRGGGPAAADKPSGHQLALTSPFVGVDPAGGPSFAIDLPSEPVRVQSQPSEDGSFTFATVRLGGPRFGVLLLVKGGPAWGSDPKRALEDETALAQEAPNGVSVLTPAGPIHRTRVGDADAYARDFVMIDGLRHLREFRVARDGDLYAFGVIYYQDDRVTLDTALAALATFRWVD
jgi:hypothetical protein